MFPEQLNVIRWLKHSVLANVAHSLTDLAGNKKGDVAIAQFILILSHSARAISRTVVIIFHVFNYNVREVFIIIVIS
ncbi:hypothetical protein D3795_09235 [Pseudidiomarina andamanensis]|uniref:Uncharacterized protein n=1 Tax=Pseudidiomarina andamanensis TaxID=1940690 RepID=A0AA92ETD2_9GAMM|nr:hypothetical protein D3795_09235 [Pseudidiomarina andamanensis]